MMEGFPKQPLWKTKSWPLYQKLGNGDTMDSQKDFLNLKGS